MTIAELKILRESEDHIEFKAATRDFNYNGGSHRDQNLRRKCVLGYVAALSNEGGGKLVLGMADKHPHDVVGTKFAENEVGAMVDDIYARMGIRVEAQDLYENGLRVLIFTVPKRPVGKLMKYEGVPLMRIGDSLRNMSDEEMFKILSEQEPDFSAKICEGLIVDQLDPNAISILKSRFAVKNNNPAFRNTDDLQALSDLELIVGNKVTYAALILLGKKESIRKYLPQSKTILEYRGTEMQIPSDWREEIIDPLFVGLDVTWKLIHSRNSVEHIHNGPYIDDVTVFDEVVVREALFNAIAHRDYSLTSEILIRQSPKKLTINNPGGFPKGVTLENIITINSTPRSRLLSEVLLKTGLVERSGQGIDKIYSISLAQGKPEPDYSSSDLFQVSLSLDGQITDSAFYLFIKNVSGLLAEDQRLSVHDIIALAKIRDGHLAGISKNVIQKLESSGLINRIGSGNSQRYILGKLYQDLMSVPLKIGNYTTSEVATVINLLAQRGMTRMGGIVEVFKAGLTREQVKFLVEKLVEDGVVDKMGKGNTTSYMVSSKFDVNDNPVGKVEAYLVTKHAS
ncbi:ATP-binding protein [Pedobacter gandavensis]|uniref:ATP-binding protein n=1 Tax=Pedobacter gandavensis TaxID=2679963 RepID=UPI00292F9E7B|nr:ATP-binding protein [Pedobacter gandavensis]